MFQKVNPFNRSLPITYQNFKMFDIKKLSKKGNQNWHIPHQNYANFEA